jgi:hypothetical protein
MVCHICFGRRPFVGPTVELLDPGLRVFFLFYFYEVKPLAPLLFSRGEVPYACGQLMADSLYHDGNRRHEQCGPDAELNQVFSKDSFFGGQIASWHSGRLFQAHRQPIQAVLQMVVGVPRWVWGATFPTQCVPGASRVFRHGLVLGASFPGARQTSLSGGAPSDVDFEAVILE